MFSDPFTSLMAVVLLAFTGLLGVFFYLWRELDSMRAALYEIQDALHLYSAEAEQQSRDIAALLREVRGHGGNAASDVAPAPDKETGELLELGLPKLEREKRPHLKKSRSKAAVTVDGAEIFRNFDADPFGKKS